MLEKFGIEHLGQVSFWAIFPEKNLIVSNTVKKEGISQMGLTSSVMLGIVRSQI